MMKKLLGITIIIFTIIIGMCGCMENCKKKVVSLESLTLIIREMKDSFVYEIAAKEEITEILFYREIFSNGETSLELEKKAVCDTKEFIEIMNTYCVMSWDGFHGKHPKYVSDGIMFNFTACVNEGITIHAEGSANFPKDYHDFVRELNYILTK